MRRSFKKGIIGLFVFSSPPPLRSKQVDLTGDLGRPNYIYPLFVSFISASILGFPCCALSFPPRAPLDLGKALLVNYNTVKANAFG